MKSAHGHRWTMFSALMIAGLMGLVAAPGWSARAQDVTPAGFETRVRIVHAAPEIGNMDVRINRDRQVEDLTYGEASDWISVDPGAARVTFERAGFNLFGGRVFDAIYPVLAGQSYQLVLTNLLVIATVYDQSPLPANTARVRLVHASVDTPSVDVGIADDPVPLISDVSFPASTDYVEVPAGDYDLEVRRAGTTAPTLPLPDITVEAGMVYDFIAIGNPRDPERPVTVIPLSVAALERTPAGTSEEGTPAA